MNFVKRMLKRARESEIGSREQYSCESSALMSIRGMVEFWADENTLSGRKLKGQDLIRWKKEFYSRIQELNEIFQEDEKLREEARK